MATSGVYTYFFWVLLQPFRGNPEYKDVADLPYDSGCLNKIATEQTDIKSLSKFDIHCDQIRRFFEFLGNKFYYKSSPNVC